MLLDPMLPEQGLDWFEGGRRPERIVLTNRHHYRRSAEFVDAFGCAVLASEPGLHEFEGGPDVQGFAFGDEVAPGVTALEVGAICPDESAILFPGGSLLAVADGVIGENELAFVPDSLLGDDPAEVRRGLREAYGRICEQHAFDNLARAHGSPIVGGARETLREFVAPE